MYVTTVQRQSARSLAAIRARMQPSEIPHRVIPMLTRVYSAMKAVGMPNDGQNVFIYRSAGGGMVDVETGVGVDGAFEAHGELVHVLTPSGPAATTTHWGDYRGLGGAHRAIVDWCAAHSRAMTGLSWEVYGHWYDDPAKVRTDVFYQVVDASNG